MLVIQSNADSQLYSDVSSMYFAPDLQQVVRKLRNTDTLISQLFNQYALPFLTRIKCINNGIPMSELQQNVRV